MSNPASELPQADVSRKVSASLALTLLVLVNLFNYIDRQVLAAVEPEIRKELFPADPATGKEPEYAKSATGWFATVFLLSYIAITPLFGLLADRIPRWSLIGFGVILWSLASGASGFDWGVSLAGAYWLLLLTRAFVGVGEAAYGPVAPAMIADLFPEAKRGKVMAFFYMAIPVGGALGYALGGGIVKVLAQMQIDDGWRWAFFGVVPPGIALGVWCFFMRDPPRGQSDDPLADDSSSSEARLAPSPPAPLPLNTGGEGGNALSPLSPACGGEGGNALSPLSPACGGEGPGVRGETSLADGQSSSEGRLAPSPPAPLPLNTGGEGGNALSPLSPACGGEGPGVRGETSLADGQSSSEGRLAPSPPAPLPLNTGGEGGNTPRKARFSDYFFILQTPSYFWNTAGMTMMCFAIGGLAFWMPEYLTRREKELLDIDPNSTIRIFGIEPITMFGMITVIAGLISTLVGGITGDWLKPRFSGSYFLVSGTALLFGFPMTLLMLWVPFPWAWGFIFLSVFFLFFNVGPTNTILANVTHPSIRGSAFALNILIIHALGDAISPPLIGWISGAEHLDRGFILVSLTMLIGGIFWLMGARHLKTDTELAPNRLPT